jgi:NAD(P)-dependent dehydrogenase (short-subunit alcohol dehydrogenase family)
LYGLKYVLRVMKEQGYGSIVNTASVGDTRGVGNQSGYSSSKHGVVGLIRNTAVEYGEFGNQKNFGSRGFRDSSIYIEYKV